MSTVEVWRILKGEDTSHSMGYYELSQIHGISTNEKILNTSLNFGQNIPNKRKIIASTFATWAPQRFVPVMST